MISLDGIADEIIYIRAERIQGIVQNFDKKETRIYLTGEVDPYTVKQTAAEVMDEVYLLEEQRQKERELL